MDRDLHQHRLKYCISSIKKPEFANRSEAVSVENSLDINETIEKSEEACRSEVMSEVNSLGNITA